MLYEIKPKKLKKGDKVAIISLSRGLLGNDSVKHELDIALNRLKEYGLEPVIMPNALASYDYLFEHPEARAQDLKDAFADDSIKGIICAIGGFDTFRTYEFLMEDEEFIYNVRNHPKIFTGFSDTTMNHLMFYRLGMESFYGPCVVVDLADPVDVDFAVPFVSVAVDLAVPFVDADVSLASIVFDTIPPSIICFIFLIATLFPLYVPK